MIYIVGNSFSGSTLLGFLLTSNPGIVFLGEIKSETWLKQQTCSCGCEVGECAFYRDYFDVFNLSKQSALKSIRNLSPLQFILRKKIALDPVTRHELQNLHGSIDRKLAELYPEIAYWVDSSKSLWLLNAWIQVVPRQEIKIIWIQRNLKSNVASFMKRGTSFLKAYSGVLFHNWLISKFLSRNRLEFLKLSYDSFSHGFEDEAKALTAFLGKEIALPRQDHHNHHATSGNTRTRKNFTYPFPGFHPDNEWRTILSPLQQKIISWLQ